MNKLEIKLYGTGDIRYGLNSIKHHHYNKIRIIKWKVYGIKIYRYVSKK